MMFIYVTAVAILSPSDIGNKPIPSGRLFEMSLFELKE